jgi:hypothetical protein
MLRIDNELLGSCSYFGGWMSKALVSSVKCLEPGNMLNLWMMAANISPLNVRAVNIEISYMLFNG